MKPISLGSREGINENVKGLKEKVLKEEDEGDSRAVLIAPVKDQERIGLPEEILFVQLVPAELHHH